LTLGKIASLLEARGEMDRAIRIRRKEVLPNLEHLGLARDLAVERSLLALTHRRRSLPGDREAAVALLHLALSEALRMRLPETARNRSALDEIGRSWSWYFLQMAWRRWTRL
jgi:hypothetical protein